ncbi:MAG: hypothetical protein RDV41_14260 [Planctomycetota bacterium]|nr:hypothetical protein [Planctomycetota bacterium]
MKDSTARFIAAACAICVVGFAIGGVLLHQDVRRLQGEVDRLRLVVLAREVSATEVGEGPLVVEDTPAVPTEAPHASHVAPFQPDNTLSLDRRLDEFARWVKSELERQETTTRTQQAEIDAKVEAISETMGGEINEEKFKQLFNKKMAEEKAAEERRNLEATVQWLIQDLAATLDLQATQKDEITRIAKEKFEQMMSFWSEVKDSSESGEEPGEAGAGVDYAALAEKQKEIGKAFAAEVDRHLTTDQSTRFAEWLKRNAWMYGDYADVQEGQEAE